MELLRRDSGVTSERDSRNQLQINWPVKAAGAHSIPGAQPGFSHERDRFEAELLVVDLLGRAPEHVEAQELEAEADLVVLDRLKGSIPCSF